MLLSSPCISFAYYVMPIGIPDPTLSWGGVQDPIDDVAPDRPVSWASEIPGYYYINDDEAGCSNTRTYGYPGYARCAIPSTIPAGTYLEIDGSYNTNNSGGNLYIVANGTNAAWSAGVSGPVWIVGEAGQTPPIISIPFLIRSSEYLYVDNIHFSLSGITGSNVLIGSGSTAGAGQNDHIALRNCEMNGDGLGGTSTHAVSLIGYAQTDKPEKILVYNCNMHDHSYTDWYQYNGFIDQDAHVIIINRYVDDIWILSNEIHDSGGTGVIAGQDYYTGDLRIDNFYVGKNHIYDTLQAGASTKGCNLTVFSQNNIHNQHSRYNSDWTLASPSKNIGYGDNTNGPLYYLYNVMHDAKYGVHGGGTADGAPAFYIVGNAIYNIYDWEGLGVPETQDGSAWDPAALYMQGASSAEIINNSLYNIDSGIHMPDAGATKIDIVGNIVSTLRYPLSMFINFQGDGTLLTDSYIDDNIFYSSGNTYMARSGGTYYSTLAALQTASSDCANCSVADPVFINPSGGNLRLMGTSPAIGMGEEWTGYDAYQTTYSLNIQYDNDSSARPIGTWDIGAYEYNEAAAPQSMGTFIFGQPQ